MSEFSFKPAKRENVSLIIALAGASGSGKTKTALELAMGLSPSGKIAMIDTEAGRGLHYAEEYKFLHADMSPPFRPGRLIEGIHAAERAGSEVVIIDSASHFYDGEGGILDWANELAEGKPKPGVIKPRTKRDSDDWWKDWEAKPVTAPGNWKEPKLAHKQMMNALLQCRAHIIFCFRADEKIKIIEPSKENNWKTQIVALGWVPICEKRTMYEMTLSFTLRPDQPGKPQYDLPHKIQDQHRAFFPEGKLISREAGAKLAAWAHGDGQKEKKPSSPPDFDADAFLAKVDEMAGIATEADLLTQWWEDPTVVAQRKLLATVDKDKSAKARQTVADRIGELATKGEV